jgi:mono/diheme cytochrome c family protein
MLKNRCAAALMAVAFCITLAAAQPRPSTVANGGKALYYKQCVACHGPEGRGVPGLNPPLTKTPRVLGAKSALINIILKGMEGPLTIDGEEYDSMMPAQPQLTDHQIADVLTYVRSNFGNKASAISAAEVKAARAKR